MSREGFAEEPLRQDQQSGPPVPVVDMAASEGEAAATLRTACQTAGFFYVKNHGVEERLLREHFGLAKQFFNLPAEEKAKVKVNNWYRGWFPPDDEKLDKAARVMDTKEGLYIGREIELGSQENKLPLHGPNNWPGESLVPGFRDAMMRYHSAFLAAGMRIIRLFALALDMPADFFDQFYTRPMAQMKMIHYPPVVTRPDQGHFGASAHTDFGMITLLATDEQPGLQVLMGNDWVDIPPRPGHLIVNLGDMMHRLSNTRFRSALHRVVTLAGQERYSTAFFYAPNFDAEITALPTCISQRNPAKWASVHYGRYLMQKYNAVHDTFVEKQLIVNPAAA